MRRDATNLTVARDNALFSGYAHFIMSMFGRSPTAPSGAVNPERMEMAIQESVFISLHIYSLPPLIRLLRLDMVTDIFNRIVS